MTYPIVQFVSAPDPGANVRFDFNSVGEWSDYDVWPGHEAFTLGAPSLEGSPGDYAVEYGTRQITLNLVIHASKTAAAGVMSALAKELVRRRTNWLMFQLSALSAPVWFRTYRTAPEALDFAPVLGVDDSGRNMLGLGVTLDADPFAYGERVTLPAVTINNDPAAVSNPCMALLPDIIGDAPAPLRVKVAFSGNMSGRKMRWSVTPYEDGAAPASPILWQIGGDTGYSYSTDTSATVTSGGFSGGSYRQISFVNPDFAQRISGLAPPATPGQYRVFVRVDRTDLVSTFQFKLNNGPAAVYDRAPTVGDHVTWVDLGTHAFPFGVPDELDDTSAVAPLFGFFAGRLDANSGYAILDAFLSIPVDTTRSEPTSTLFTDWYGECPTTGQYAVFDGDTESYGLYATAGTVASGTPPVLSGDFLEVTPGADNVLHLLQQTSVREGINGDNCDEITNYSVVTLSYHPRWLHLAGA